MRVFGKRSHVCMPVCTVFHGMSAGSIACVMIPHKLSLVLSLASKKEHHFKRVENSTVCIIGTFFRKESTQRNMWRNQSPRSEADLATTDNFDPKGNGPHGGSKLPTRRLLAGTLRERAASPLAVDFAAGIDNLLRGIVGTEKGMVRALGMPCEEIEIVGGARSKESIEAVKFRHRPTLRTGRTSHRHPAQRIPSLQQTSIPSPSPWSRIYARRCLCTSSPRRG
jgi:hypothetical protein